MGGQTIQKCFENEAKEILAIYKNIESLLPRANASGSSHPAEEGRFVEYLIRGFLKNTCRHLLGFIAVL